MDNLRPIEYTLGSQNPLLQDFQNSINPTSTMKYDKVTLKYVELSGHYLTSNAIILNLHIGFNFQNPTYILPTDELLDIQFDICKALNYAVKEKISYINYIETDASITFADTRSDYAVQPCKAAILSGNIIRFRIVDTTYSNSNVQCKAEHVDLNCFLILLTK